MQKKYIVRLTAEERAELEAMVKKGKATAYKTSREAEIKELHAKIGQLTVEKDFLAKAFGR